MHIENFDDLKRLLENHLGETQRLVLSERVKPKDQQRETNVHVATWDVPPAPPGAGAAEAEAPSLLDVTADPDDQDQALPGPKAALIPLAMAWVRARALSATRYNGRDCKFQVKLLRTGGGYIASCLFTVLVGETDDKLAKAYKGLRAVTSDNDAIPYSVDLGSYPTMREVTGEANLQALELMGLTGSFVQRIVLPVFGQAVQLSEHQIKRLLTHNDSQHVLIVALERRNRDLEGQLAAMEMAKSVEERAIVMKEKTMGRAIDQIGGLARSYLSAKTGLHPRAAALVDLLLKDQQLMEAVTDDRLIKLLEDPDERPGIIAMLENLARAYDMREAQRKQETGEVDNGAGQQDKKPPTMDADFPAS